MTSMKDKIEELVDVLSFNLWWLWRRFLCLFGAHRMVTTWGFGEARSLGGEYVHKWTNPEITRCAVCGKKSA